MPIKIIDVHAHIQFSAFKDDCSAVIRRALDNGVGIINVGTQKDTSKAAVELAREYPYGVWAAVGLHPVHASESYYDEQELSGGKGFLSRGEEFDYEYYKKLAENSKVVAIGECGLDYYRINKEDFKIKDKQKIVFIKQIELAAAIKKPLMIHCRSAFDDLINILKIKSSKLKADDAGVIHFFSGSKENMKQLFDLGFSFTFGGVVTFARDYDEVIKFLPLERILLETDAPYVAPAPYRGRRNEPAYIVETAKKIAEIKNLSYEEIITAATANGLRIFNLAVN